MPQFGILQNINTETIKQKSLTDYSEYSKLHSKLNVNLDFVSKFECKHQGEYYITTVIPKAGINYLPSDMPKHVKQGFDEDPSWYTTEVLNQCKSGQQVNIIVVNWMVKGMSIQAQHSLMYAKDEKTGNHFYIGCGKTDISYEEKGCSANCNWVRKSISFWDKPFTVHYFGPNNQGQGSVRDWTLEFQLQMMANKLAIN